MGRIFKFFGFMFLLAVALVVVLMVAAGDPKGEVTTSKPTVSQQTATSPEEKKPTAFAVFDEEHLVGSVELIGSEDPANVGQSCDGKGKENGEGLFAGSSVEVISLKRGEFQGILSGGTVSQYGACEFTFSTPLIRDDGMVYFYFDGDQLIIECNVADHFGLTADFNDSVHIRVAPNGAWCQR